MSKPENAQALRDNTDFRLHIETSKHIAGILWRNFKKNHSGTNEQYTLTQRLELAHTELLRFRHIYHNSHYPQPSIESQTSLVQNILSFRGKDRWYTVSN